MHLDNLAFMECKYDVSEEISSSVRRYKNKKIKSTNRKKGPRFVILILFFLIIAGIAAYSLLNTSNNDKAAVGASAPNIPITLTNGTTVQLSKFYGHAVLLWFVTTWCSGCEESAQILSTQYYSQLTRSGVIILTVESYNNLGYPGPSISQFAQYYAGGVRPNWLFGTTTQQATYIYNPQADLDIFYVINSAGQIVYRGTGLGAEVQQVFSYVS